MKNEDMSKLRQRVLSNRSDVRKKALAEVKKLPPGDGLPILVSLLGEKNEDVQHDVTKAFLSFKDAALPYLVEALTNPLWQIRKTASVIIGALGDGALKELLELIPRNEDDVDYWMVQSLSIMAGEALPYLVKAFDHPNERICLAAVRAAGNVRDAAIVPPLLKMLEKDDWPIRKAAYDSLEKVADLNEGALIEALKNFSSEAKYWVIKLVSTRHNQELLGLLADIVDQDSMENKLEAIRAIAMIETVAAHKVLVGYLAHKSWIIRKTAADAIWEQGLGASEELLTAVGATNVDTRYWSVKLLGKTNEPKVFAKVATCLNDPQPSVRAAACQALGALGDKRALAPLMELMTDGSEEVRTSAILAVSQIGERDESLKMKPSVPRHLREENQYPCPHCQKKVGRDFTFCPFCLGHLRTTCPKCGKTVEAGWKGCAFCGEPLG